MVPNVAVLLFSPIPPIQSASAAVEVAVVPVEAADDVFVLKFEALTSSGEP